METPSIMSAWKLIKLAFLSRNLNISSTSVKEQAFKYVIRPSLIIGNNSKRFSVWLWCVSCLWVCVSESICVWVSCLWVCVSESVCVWVSCLWVCVSESICVGVLFMSVCQWERLGVLFMIVCVSESVCVWVSCLWVCVSESVCV
jgi:hypothetical protein